MASDSIATSQDLVDAKRVSTRISKSNNPILKVLNSLASLKLTVFLFALSIFLVWVGTFAQDKEGIWDVVKHYFRSFFVWVPFNVFLPKSWFGDTWESVRGGFWFLGGKSIGTALFINLLAAHAVRFRVQTRGTRLWVGLAVTAFGSALAFMVIANGNLKDGIQDKPLFNWETLWGAMVAGTVLSWVVMLVALFRVPAKMFLERILLMLGFALLTGGLGWMVYLTATGGRLDDSSLRILWQLVQGTVAGGVLLVGCVLAFKKRAGMVLLHAGIGLMMLNELLVAQYANEEQLTVAEGEIVGFARDTRTVEIAVINRDDPKQDMVVVIPRDHLVPGEMIEHELLPFNIFVERFDRNSLLEEKTTADNLAAVGNYKGDPIKISAGLGQFFDIKPLRPVAGADASSKVDVASAYVSIWDKEKTDEKDPLATLLLSQQAYRAGVEETIVIGETKYSLGLRHKHNYKPYKIELKDVSRDLYVGTMSPKGYASEFDIIDVETGNRQPGDISMNDPLRYKGETFYQSGYHMDESGRELTTIQIVTNDGWMIPYVACMLVVVGMLAHFGLTLMRFMRREDSDAPMLFGGLIAFVAAGGTGVRLWRETIERKRRTAEFDKDKRTRLKEFEKKSGKGGKSESATPGEEAIEAEVVGSSMSRRAWLILGGTLGLATLITLYYAGSSPNRGTDFDFKSAGSIPVVNEGRVMPFDALARHTLRVIRNRETVNDENEDKQEAIKWMMDVMADRDEAKGYHAFRITNLEVQSLLKLKPRKRHVFSYEEVNRERESFEARYEEARGTPTEKLTIFQKAILDHKKSLNTYETLQRIYRMPPADGEELDTEKMLERIDLAVFLQDNIEQIPLGVTSATPNEDGELTWECYHLAATRQWLVKLAQEKNAKSSDELATALFQELVPDREEFIEQRYQLELFQAAIQFERSRNPDLAGKELEDRAMASMIQLERQAPPQSLQRVRDDARDELLQVRQRFFDAVARMFGDSGIQELDNPAVDHWTDMLVAYKADDAETFNASVDAQLAYMGKAKAEDLSSWRVSYEAFYHRFSPLFVSCTLYLLAGLLSVLAWIGWTRDLNRAAFWLLTFTLAIHTFALLSRMIISGRPPVTNLYSSAVFIGWGAVIISLVLEMVFRIGIGNVLGSVFGFVTLMIAYGLSLSEDTFQVLQAVLDTQFWLATHVVCITIGYATTFVAGGLGIAYIMAGIISRTLDSDMRKMIARMLYGMVCFSIFFSFFGTVLGGLWADDSWGRFWGWDPKENGALLIVIWNALVLHARWGGLVRERGIATLAVAGNIVTIWSWFLVNQLGIGLHSYGFNEGVLTYSAIAVLLHLVVIGFGCLPTKYWSSYRESPSGG